MIVNVKQLENQIQTLKSTNTKLASENASLIKAVLDATKLAEASINTIQELKSEVNRVAKEAGKAVEATVVESATPASSISETTKDNLIETLNGIDSELASDLTQVIVDSEIAGENLDGEKIASIAINIFSRLGSRLANPMEFTDKTASRNGGRSSSTALSGSIQDRIRAQKLVELRDIENRING